MKSESNSYDLDADPAAIEFQSAGSGVIRLHSSQTEELETVLSRAFFPTALFRHLVPDERIPSLRHSAVTRSEPANRTAKSIQHATLMVAHCGSIREVRGLSPR